MGFVISFLVIGALWAAHHRVFGMLGDYDSRLVMPNIVLLMVVAFMPFATALMSSNPLARVPELFYSATLLLAGLLQCWLFGRALREPYLRADVIAARRWSRCARAAGHCRSPPRSRWCWRGLPGIQQLGAAAHPPADAAVSAHRHWRGLRAGTRLRRRHEPATARHAGICAGGASLGWFALALQLLLTVQLTRSQGGSTLAAVWIYLDYFTVHHQCRAGRRADRRGARRHAAASAAGWCKRKASPRSPPACWSWAWSTTSCCAACGNPTGWQRLADELLHVVMPLLGLGLLVAGDDRATARARSACWPGCCIRWAISPTRWRAARSTAAIPIRFSKSPRSAIRAYWQMPPAWRASLH